MERFMKRITWPTAVIVSIALVVLGAVLLFAPDKTVEALFAFFTFLFGALLKGLFHGQQVDRIETEIEKDDR